MIISSGHPRRVHAQSNPHIVKCFNSTVDGRLTLGHTILFTILDLLSDLMGKPFFTVRNGQLVALESSHRYSGQPSPYHPPALVPQPLHKVRLGYLPLPLHLHGNLRHHPEFPASTTKGSRTTPGYSSGSTRRSKSWVQFF